MSNYGGLTGPGSHGFPGWPSKVHGAPSGGGRHNAPAGGGPLGSPPPGAVPLGTSAPSSNFDAAGQRLVPDGIINAEGSQYIVSMYYQCAGNRSFECHNLEVQCKDEEHREYLNGNMPFELIYMIVTSANPGETYDRLIHTNPELPFTAFYGEREWFKPSGA